MTTTFDYKTAFITGASSGLGYGLAKRLASSGVHVIAAARREDRLRALREEVASAGGKLDVHVHDVVDAPGTDALIKRVDDAVGGLDLVIANAGVARHRWSGKLQLEDVAPIVAVNVLGAVATLTSVLPRMVERKRGHVVGISSLAQYRGFPRNATYCATKAFLSTFMEGMRADLHGTGVSVTDVRPGFVRTEMTASNKFPMPFLMDLEDAIDAIVAGLVKRENIIAFPWQLAAIARSSTLLPAYVYDRAVTRVRGDR